MEQTSKELPNFLLVLTFLILIQQRAQINPKKIANCTFCTFLGTPAAANFGRQTLNGNKKVTNWSLTAFLYLLLFLNFFNLGNEVYSYQLRIYQTIKVRKNLSAANIFATQRQITVTLCLNIKCYNLFPLRI